MKIDKIYRLIYICEDSESAESPFFTNKQDALNYLEDMKEKIRVIYEDDDGQPLEGFIILQEIDLNEIEDIDLYSKNTEISEWVFDEEYTKEYQKDMANAGVTTDIMYGMWEDKQ